MDGKKIIKQLEKDNPNPKPVKPLWPAKKQEFLSKLNRVLHSKLELKISSRFSSQNELGRVGTSSGKA